MRTGSLLGRHMSFTTQGQGVPRTALAGRTHSAKNYLINQTLAEKGGRHMRAAPYTP